MTQKQKIIIKLDFKCNQLYIIYIHIQKKLYIFSLQILSISSFLYIHSSGGGGDGGVGGWGCPGGGGCGGGADDMIL